MSERTGERVNDIGPWPQWTKTPPLPATTPFHDDAATQLHNTESGLAQLSAIVPLIGPGVTFAASRRGSATRRQAAKAFNGQIAALLVMAMALGPTVLIYFAMNPHFDLPAFYGFPVAVGSVFLGWVVQARIATARAFRGHDWTSPLVRVLHTEVLPENNPPPAKNPGQG